LFRSLYVAEAQSRAIVKVFEEPASLDPSQEAVDIVTRYETLRSSFGDDSLSISKNRHKFKEHEQFDYRDRLYEFAEGGAGAKVIVQDWEMYGKKDVLRKVWRELERTGEAHGWVKGVGEGGLEEWVELMRNLLKKVDEDQREKRSKL
jgi:hypothetical protein